MSPTNERDAGFCSGGSENEEDSDQAHHTDSSNSTASINSPPTDDVSEDSVEVKLPISLVINSMPNITITSSTVVPKNKRKSSEPIRVVSVDHSAPIKKRIRFENEQTIARNPQEPAKKFATVLVTPIEKLKGTGPENGLLLLNRTAAVVSPETAETINPFRPWASVAQMNDEATQLNDYFDPAETLRRHPGVTTLHRIPDDKHYSTQQIPVQDEPMSLVARKSSEPTVKNAFENSQMISSDRKMIKSRLSSQSKVLELDSKPDQPSHQSLVNPSRTPSIIDDTSSTASSYNLMSTIANGLNLSTKMGLSVLDSVSSGKHGGRSSAQSSQRNYKNMTRERRIEANARERTRVHTISAAFDKLRHTIPSYSNTQKLSKLSVLRIACSYILSLSRVAGMDYSEDQSEPSISDCIESVTKTIQTEGKLRKKKDE